MRHAAIVLETFFWENHVVCPLLFTIPQVRRKELLRKEKKISRQGKTMLIKIWIRKNKFPVLRKENFSIVPSILEILSELLKPHRIIIISNDSDFQIHLKRQSNECFINNYFAEGLEAWKANIDIQPFFNHYKAVT